MATDWQFIQSEYDSGKSYRDLTVTYGISTATLNKGRKSGLFKTLSRSEANKRRAINKPSRKLTESERKAISERVKELFRRRPELHPNRKVANNRSKMSYPERLAFDWLTANNIQFVHNANIGSYYIDFLLGNLAIEIDGKYWHDLEYDARRDLHLSELGIKVVRIPAAAMVADKENEILLSVVTGNTDKSILENFLAKKREIHYCICGKSKWKNARTCRSCRPGKPKIQWPADLLARISNSSMLKVAAELGVSQRGISKHLKSHFGYTANSSDPDSFNKWLKAKREISRGVDNGRRCVGS
jgi:very-short-patch-repair endonuclease